MNLNQHQDAFKHVIPDQNNHLYQKQHSQFCSKKPQNSQRARILENLEILNFFNFNIFQDKSRMQYIKLQVNWNEEFIYVVKTDIGAPQILRVICRLLGNQAQGFYFLGQKCSLSSLMGALVASYKVLGHLTTYFSSCMPIYR